MKYTLFSAVDTRDNKPMLWLMSHDNFSVAQFHPKTSPSRIKRNSLSPDFFVWSNVCDLELFADGITTVDSWEWPE